jgi:hypothetical protein
LDEYGSKGSSSSSPSSPGLREERRDELGVRALGNSDWLGTKGAAMAKLEVARGELCAHKSGDGVSALMLAKEPGLEDAEERGRGIGLNSEALAFRRRGEDRGDDGKLDAAN